MYIRLPNAVQRRRSERGIALIVVMIAIFVLSMIAWNFASTMKTEFMLARNSSHEAELEWIGRSGVEYAKWVLAANCAQFDSLNQVWAGGDGDLCATNPPLSLVQKEVNIGHGSFTWKITDNESKANINMAIAPGAGERLLEQGLVLAGVDPGEMTSIKGAIQDWLDPDDQPHLDGAENSYYHGLNPPYDAKNGPIDDLSELLLIKGITPDIYWGPNSTNHQAGIIQQQINRFAANQPNGVQQNPVGLVDLFTPMSSGRINVNTASAEVLQLIPGIDPPMAQAIVDGRQGEDDGSGLLGPYPTVEAVRRIPEVSPIALNAIRQFCTHESRTFRVEITAKIDNYTRQFVAIVRRNDRHNPRGLETLTFYWK